LVEQLGKVLAAMLAKRQAKDPEAARRILIDGCQELLGIEYSVLTCFDAQSAADLLRDPLKIRMLAELVAAEADVAKDLGDAHTANDRLTFALSLLDCLAPAVQQQESNQTLRHQLETALTSLD
jgi:hypothetical protein